MNAQLWAFLGYTCFSTMYRVGRALTAPLHKDCHIACYLSDTFSGTGYKRKRKHVSFYWYGFSIAERLESNCPSLVPEGERRSGFSNRKEGCGVFIFYFFVFLFDVHVCVCC